MMRIHKEVFSVRGYEVDSSNHATVQTLCQYLQESAGKHAGKLGVSLESLQAKGFSWAISRMQIAVSALPSAGEQVAVETWPVNVERLSSRRDFRITGKNGCLLARAISHWVVINLATRRLARMQGLIDLESMTIPQEVMDNSGLRLDTVAQEHERAAFKVRLYDIDRNQHVNNARYLDWVCESIPTLTRNTATLRYVELLFKAEALYGDEVTVRSLQTVHDDQDTDNIEQVFSHSLHRMSDQRELVRACSIWKQ